MLSISQLNKLGFNIKKNSRSLFSSPKLSSGMKTENNTMDNFESKTKRS